MLNETISVPCPFATYSLMGMGYYGLAQEVRGCPHSVPFYVFLSTEFVLVRDFHTMPLFPIMGNGGKPWVFLLEYRKKCSKFLPHLPILSNSWPQWFSQAAMWRNHFSSCSQYEWNIGAFQQKYLSWFQRVRHKFFLSLYLIKRSIFGVICNVDLFLTFALIVLREQAHTFEISVEKPLETEEQFGGGKTWERGGKLCCRFLIPSLPIRVVIFFERLWGNAMVPPCVEP